MAAATVKIRLRHLILTLFAAVQLSSATRCGPLGYRATDLLKPAYWYFDLSSKECDKFPKPDRYDKMIPPNTTEHACRFYLNVCQSMKYQCAGTACLRYLYTDDYVSLLGAMTDNPFSEGQQHFETLFYGDRSLCSNKLAELETQIKFTCDENTKWNTTVVHHHGGALAPKPLTLNFDKQSCKLNVHFNYSGACIHLKPGEKIGKSISVGSVLLILFFPGLALYFIIGMLINRMAGHRGKDCIPHAAFWLALPDLIMDGFVFTMATITCKREEARTNYETM
eukprot:gene9601-10588_t